MAEPEYIRVHFIDGSFVTLAITEATTAGQVCDTVQRKRRTSIDHDDRPSLPLSALTELDENIHSDSIGQYDSDSIVSTNASTVNSNVTVIPSSSSSARSHTLTAALLEAYALYVHDTYRHESDRRLPDEAVVTDTVTHWRNGGLTDRFQLVYRKCDDADDSGGLSDSDGGGGVTVADDDDNESLTVTSSDSSLEFVRKHWGARIAGYLDHRVSGSQWKPKFAMLVNDKLLLFKSHSTSAPNQTLAIGDATIEPLSLYSALSLIDTHTSTASNTNMAHTVHIFEIITPQKIYYLRAHSAALLSQWIHSLRRATSIEKENQLLIEFQCEVDSLALSDSDNDQRRETLMRSSMLGAMEDDHSIEWMCHIAMETKQFQHLLCWMDLQVWFYVQRRIVGRERVRRRSRASSFVGGMAGGVSSASPALTSPLGVSNASPVSLSPRNGGQLLTRRPSFNFAAGPSHSHSLSQASSLMSSPSHAIHTAHLLQRSRNRRYSINTHHIVPRSSLPPSSYLPTLSTSLIFARYVDRGTDMDVGVSDECRESLRAIIMRQQQSATDDNDKELELSVMDTIERHCADTVHATIHDTFIHSKYLQLALIGIPVRGGTFYTHHPYRFVLSELKAEHEEEDRAVRALEQREQQERAEIERRKTLAQKQRRKSGGLDLNYDSGDEREESTELTVKPAARKLLLNNKIVSFRRGAIT